MSDTLSNEAKIALYEAKYKAEFAEEHRLALLNADFASINYRLILLLIEQNKLEEYVSHTLFRHRRWKAYGDNGYIFEYLGEFENYDHVEALSKIKNHYPNHKYYRLLPDFGEI